MPIPELRAPSDLSVVRSGHVDKCMYSHQGARLLDARPGVEMNCVEHRQLRRNLREEVATESFVESIGAAKAGLFLYPHPRQPAFLMPKYQAIGQDAHMQSRLPESMYLIPGLECSSRTCLLVGNVDPEKQQRWRRALEKLLSSRLAGS
ncbi:hypothetical protein CMUS01_04356 [Colletotrichum musicola]|uniref:Uncharacterized protein n=1 Tax=Colletotrichum musicola TaxID=2175873 RepID=A0A8H6NNI6_9PEZI|nr:hypothetical protein CMUS01_04356 [Colletotrichum musicola]